MSVQYRSQLALACAEPDCARLECPPQPGGSGDFTVCAAFWPQHADGSGLLIRQDDGLALGYSGGNIYMEVPGVGRASSVPQDSHLIENEWNIAGAMYSGGAIQLYLNGRPVAANLVKKQETACRAGTAAPWDLGVFNGYLQRISFYDRGLSETEMCRTAFAPLPDVALDVDFNGYLPRTSGTQPNAVRLLGKCDTVNLVQALHPGRMGCALSIAGIPPVSDGFTLLVNVISAGRNGENGSFSSLPECRRHRASWDWRCAMAERRCPFFWQVGSCPPLSSLSSTDGWIWLFRWRRTEKRPSMWTAQRWEAEPCQGRRCPPL